MWPGKVLKVKKALYGLKQSANEWYGLLSSTLEELGWSRCESDPCVILMDDISGRSFLAVYVDDLVIISPTLKDITGHKEKLTQKFKCKDLGSICHILGIVVEYDQESGCLLLNQKQQIQRSLTTNGIASH